MTKARVFETWEAAKAAAVWYVRMNYPHISREDARVNRHGTYSILRCDPLLAGPRGIQDKKVFIVFTDKGMFL